jgi:hypothetical protein
LKAKELTKPLPAVVNDRGEVVSGEPLRLPQAMKDVADPPIQRSSPSSSLIGDAPRDLNQSNLAEDDSRRRMPRPVFDEEQRRSGFPAYTSPRQSFSKRQRQALSFMQFGSSIRRRRQEEERFRSFLQEVREEERQEWLGRINRGELRRW